MRSSRQACAASPGAFRSLAVLLVLCAVVLRAGIPAGWMPSPQASFAAPLVICTADGAHLLAPAQDGKPPRPNPARRHDVCVFAGHHATPGPTLHPIAGPARFVRLAGLRAAPYSPPAIPVRHRDQAQRAPPLSI